MQYGGTEPFAIGAELGTSVEAWHFGRWLDFPEHRGRSLSAAEGVARRWA